MSLSAASEQPTDAPESAHHSKPGITASQAAALLPGLLESRQRWQQFGTLASDILFETDAAGQWSFIEPDTALGWPAAGLLGQPAASILADPAGPNPFQSTGPLRRKPTWLRTQAGTPACMALTLTPILDQAGRFRGLRGVGVDVTQEERAAKGASVGLRRGLVLDRLLTQMRQEVLAPSMMGTALDAVIQALGCQAAAIIDLMQVDQPAMLHAVGADLAPRIGPVLPLLTAGDDTIRFIDLTAGEQILVCPCSTRYGERAALLAWRKPGHRPWEADDPTLAGAIAGVIRIVLEHEAIQRGLARQARTDPLTGLVNHRMFIEEAERRLDRQEREWQPGTLLLIDVDGLRHINDRLGHEAGDAALKLTSALLQRTFRPSDLIARLGGDEFAVWLDGADSLTAAERAESLCQAMPKEFSHLTEGEAKKGGVSIGIATRDPGSNEMLEQMIHRADRAMHDVKRGEGGHWRVSLAISRS